MRAFTEFDFVETVWPSAANFFLARVRASGAVMDHCASQGVLLRDFGGSLAGCIRVTVGTAAENDRLLECLGNLDGGS